MTDDITADDLTTGTELIYQTPTGMLADADYHAPVRGTVVETREESYYVGTREKTKTVVVLETAEGEEKTISIGNLVGQTDHRVNIVPNADADEDDDEDDETHECEECGDEFESAHGLSIHEGMVHSEDDQQDSKDATSTEAEPVAIADGGCETEPVDVADLNEGDRVLWGDRQNALTVAEIHDDGEGATLESERGTVYHVEETLVRRMSHIPDRGDVHLRRVAEADDDSIEFETPDGASVTVTADNDMLYVDLDGDDIELEHEWARPRTVDGEQTLYCGRQQTDDGETIQAYIPVDGRMEQIEALKEASKDYDKPLRFRVEEKQKRKVAGTELTLRPTKSPSELTDEQREQYDAIDPAEDVPDGAEIGDEYAAEELTGDQEDDGDDDDPNGGPAALAEGDYIVGESGVYEVSKIEDTNEEPYLIEVASPRPDHSDGQQSNAGWSSESLVKSLGQAISRDSVESIAVSDGSDLIWETAHEDGSSAIATVSVADDGTVSLQSDGLLVPETMPDLLTLRCNIAVGTAHVIDELDEEEALAKAQETGERIKIDSTTIDCDGSEGDECSTDRVTRYATPDGVIEAHRSHLY